jgi:glycosyltransferase involved in cell wall biosynthesis
MSGQPFLLVSGDFVKTGGMDRANHAMASHLASQGREVHIVAFRIDDELRRTPGVVFHRVPKPGGSYTLALPLLDRLGRRWAKRLTNECGARVIVNGGCCRWGDVNWVHYVHAAHRPQVRHGLPRWLATSWNHHRWVIDERLALTQARIVITNSRRTRDDLIERVGVDPTRVHVVYLGVDAERFAPVTRERKAGARRELGIDEHRPIVAFIGAMSDRRKGFDIVFDAWTLLCREAGRWDAQLLVIGAGAEVPKWQNAAADAGIESRVRFLGLRADVPEILRACDLLVAPSRYEPYGLSVHEALCCGVPAIVSEAAGVAERYPPAMSRWLLPDRLTPAELASRLRDWQRGAIGGLDELPALSDTLRARTWHHMAAEMSRLIKLTGDEPAASGKRMDRG